MATFNITVGDTVTPRYANWIGKVIAIEGDVITVAYDWGSTNHYAGALQVLPS